MNLFYRPPTNEHGVTGEWAHTGSQFGELQPDGKILTYAPVFIPDCCLNCEHFDIGDFGEFNDRLSPPYCKVNLRFPTKKGSCKRKKARY